MGLMIPGAFHATHQDQNASEGNILVISRVTSILLMVAYFVYIDFQLRTHNEFYEEMLEAEEMGGDPNEHKLCVTECVLSVVLSLIMVTLLAINLVAEIPFIVEEQGVSESFLGLILVPIVEKAAEHITTVEEAMENHMTAVIFDVLGSAIQTAMFNTPLVVLIGWAMGHPLDLEFELFNMIVLVLSLLVVSSFTKDCKSNYLEGVLCLIVYLLIAIGSYFD
jgi:Ca2+:H+ antiporter